MNLKDKIHFGSLAIVFSFLIVGLVVSTGGYRSKLSDRTELAQELREADRAVAGAQRSEAEFESVEASLAAVEQNGGSIQEAVAEDASKAENVVPDSAANDIVASPRIASDAAEEDEEEPAYLVHAEEISRDTVPVSTVLASIEEAETEIILPGKFGPMKPRTPVTVSFIVDPGRAKNLLLQFTASPVKVYINDVLFYSGGEELSYPRILKDPPTELLTLPLPDTDQDVNVRMELLSPVNTDRLTLFAPQVGTEEAIFMSLLKSAGLPLLLSLMFLVSGLMMILLSLGFLKIENHGVFLRLPGIFAMCTGFWLFGGNNLAIFLLRQPSLLHILSYAGMYSMPIPLFLFSIKLLSLEELKLLRIATYFLETCVFFTFFLQLTGLVPFAASSMVFAPMLFISLAVLTGIVLKETLSEHDQVSLYYFFALLILLLSIVMYWFGTVHLLSGPLTLIYELGVVVFLVLMILIASLKMQYFYSLKGQNAKLQDELRLMEKVIDAQKARNRMLVEHANSVKEQRHDLRHHLNVMKVMLDEGKPEELSAYLENLTAQIPVDRSVTYCDHEIANALLSYYASLAAAEKIQLEIHAQIPGKTSEISDDSLCVIIGNLLENAVESCRRMHDGKRFIQFNTKAQGDLLFIAQDNSYEKEPSKKDGYFISSKRDEVGTGLLSVQSVAERYGGKAYFEAKDGRFRSEVYVHM